MSLTRTDPNPFDLVRPFVVLAVFAFFVGFATYMVLGGGNVATAHSRSDAAAPISSDHIDWGSRKAI
ncbi:hypothetical protein [Phenylobacterium sp.]|uniref:hypothetical protein n=1 Tax=Phenylobacterium sp. TaxID=1871053 RepID=UPI00286E23E9|nr:hypothetical protein [Phenylobacterium sp.]